MDAPTFTTEEVLKKIDELAPGVVTLAHAQLSAEAWQRKAEELNERLEGDDG